MNYKEIIQLENNIEEERIYLDFLQTIIEENHFKKWDKKTWEYHIFRLKKILGK